MANHAVLEAFQRFDVDGSGSISREELGNVLKTLDPEEFDDAKTDELLTAADASGDGQLQINEFMSWIFAEDEKLSANQNICGFTVLVEGCSKNKLNGEYVQQDKISARRPVFYCASRSRYLFYHAGHQAWQIHSRISTRASARLKTRRSPHMAGAVWEVRKTGDQGVQYVEESDMSCRVAPPPDSVEEMIARAPKHIYVKAEDSRIHGGFSKNDQPWNGRPTWFNNLDKTFLLFDNENEKSFWKVCTNPKDPKAILARSSSSSVWSPELTFWEGQTTVMAIDPYSDYAKEIEEKYRDTEGPEIEEEVELFWNKDGEGGFVDPEFPHTEESLQLEKMKDYPKEWARAIYLDNPVVLFEDIEPANVCQGCVGDCWLIAAIAAVAEFPSYIKEHLFQQKNLTEEGKYEIRLFDWTTQEWKMVTIDDCIPCAKRNKYHSKPVTLLAKACGGEAYVPLLEKAFAKFVGSYGKLHGGFPILAWMAMTGETGIFRWIRQTHHPKWVVTSGGVLVHSAARGSGEKLGRLCEGAKFEELQKDGYFIKFKKLEGEGPEEGWLSEYLSGSPTCRCYDQINWKMHEQNFSSDTINFANLSDGKALDEQDNEGLWQKIREYDDANYLMGCYMYYGEASELVRPDGLVHGHAYSIIHAVEIEGLKLICCRNPWGRTEWNGPWNDQSQEWTKHPDVAKALNVAEKLGANVGKQDGIFWMTWQDFNSAFNFIGVCPRSMPTKRGDFDVTSFGASEDL